MGFFDGLLQLGFGLVGGALGGPLGFAIGSLIGGALFGPKAEAPKVKAQDLKLQKSEYGEFVPIYYGTVRAAGIVIDCDPKGGVEHQTKKKSVRTGLFSKTEVKEFRYFLTCAVLLGEGVYNQAGDGQLIVDRLLYGEDVLYDRNGTNTTPADNDSPPPFPFFNAPTPKSNPKGYALTYDAATGMESSGSGKNSIALYRGNYRQNPDPVLSALHGGAAPAYRGQAYLRINQLPLKKFDNELRTITAIMRRVDAAGATIEELTKIIPAHMQRGGMASSQIHAGDLNGTVRGAFMTQRGGARELVERLAAWKFCDAVEMGDGIHFVSRVSPTLHTIPAEELNARLVRGGGNSSDARSDTTSQQGYDVDVELPSAIDVTFQDVGLNYDTNTAPAVRQTATHEKVETVDMPLVATLNEALQFARIALDEAWEAREGGGETLPPRRLDVAPGDVLALPSIDSNAETNGSLRYLRIASQTLEQPGAIQCEGKRWSPHVYQQSAMIVPPGVSAPTVRVLSVPRVAFFETPATSLESDALKRPGAFIAASAPAAELWAGAEIKSSKSNGFGTVTIDERATMGIVLEDVALGDGAKIEYSRTIALYASYGALGNTTEMLLRAGANQIAIGSRVLRFLNATQTGPGLWTISGILDGLYGSEWTGTIAAGEPWALLTDAVGEEAPGVLWLDGALSTRNKVITYRIAPDSDEDDELQSEEETLTLHGHNLKALAPAHVDATLDDGAFRVTWRARARGVDNLDLSNAVQSDPLTFDVVLYGDGAARSGVVLTRRVTAGSAQSEIVYSAGDLAAAFPGGLPPLLTGDVFHVNDYGRGFAAPFEVST